MNWDAWIANEIKESYFQNLITFLKNEDQTSIVLPPKEDRLRALRLTPYDKIKVVILGQDPYHNINQAHGLAFSVKHHQLPPSLKNIFKELKDDLSLANIPTSGDLTAWAKQGVLLLNTTLTVRIHEPMSHQKQGWEIFTRKIIEKINEKSEPIVFILWGSHAQQFKPLLNHNKHLILTAPHPSPLSAHRGFFGSKPFSKANAFLKANQRTPIDWKLS